MDIKVGDTVRLRSEDLASGANAPMVVSVINRGDHGATAVCKRQGTPVGEFSLEALVKVDAPPDQAEMAKKQKEGVAQPPPAANPNVNTYSAKKK